MRRMRPYLRLVPAMWAAPASIVAQVHHNVVTLGLRLVPLVVVVRTGWAWSRAQVVARVVVPAGLLVGRLGPLQLAHLVTAGVVAAGAGQLERVRQRPSGPVQLSTCSADVHGHLSR